jgi:hypothetical protein
MRKRSTRFTAALFALGAALAGAPTGSASSSAPLAVADLVGHSPQIVAGTVSAVTDHADPGSVPFTEIQMNVDETVRGDAAKTLTFRQFGLQSPRPAENGRRYVGIVAGLPQYRVGEHVVLFLGPTSRLGLRTTTGLGQGRFVQRGGVLVNETNNSGLFRGVNFSKKHLNTKETSMVAVVQGGVAPDTFLGLIRRAVNEKWWDAPAPTRTGPGSPRQPATPHQASTEGGIAR